MLENNEMILPESNTTENAPKLDEQTLRAQIEAEYKQKLSEVIDPKFYKKEKSVVDMAADINKSYKEAERNFHPKATKEATVGDLGENGAERIKAITSWLSNKSESEREYYKSTLKTKEDFERLERIKNESLKDVAPSIRDTMEFSKPVDNAALKAEFERLKKDKDVLTDPVKEARHDELFRMFAS
jgi:pyruvate/2-oxoacid:ferredoxin oxidoreductase beta subunit